jgi:hypothetical protein
MIRPSHLIRYFKKYTVPRVQHYNISTQAISCPICLDQWYLCVCRDKILLITSHAEYNRIIRRQRQYYSTTSTGTDAFSPL